VVPCGQTDSQADMTKLIVAFRNFANAARNYCTPNKCKLKLLTYSDRGVCGFPKPHECRHGNQVVITGWESGLSVHRKGFQAGDRQVHF
jgi:hypothetical protein